MLRGQRSHGLNGCHGHADVRFMFIGQIVGIDHLGKGRGKHGNQIVPQFRAARVLHHRAAVVELDHRTELSNPCGQVLFFPADASHFVIAEVCKSSGARTSCAVGAGDAGEPFPLFSVARENAVEGHKLQIIMVGSDSQVRRAAERSRFRFPIRD